MSLIVNNSQITPSSNNLPNTVVQRDNSGSFSCGGLTIGDYARLQFGGTTTAFPAIQKQNIELQIKDATGADFAGLRIGNLRYNLRAVSIATTGLFNDSILHCVTGGFTITLPPANTATGMNLIVKDVSGAAAQTNIIITGSGSQLIDGVLSYTINSNYSSISLYADGESTWSII